jgi:hypothetical protein
MLADLCCSTPLSAQAILQYNVAASISTLKWKEFRSVYRLLVCVDVEAATIKYITVA